MPSFAGFLLVLIVHLCFNDQEDPYLNMFPPAHLQLPQIWSSRWPPGACGSRRYCRSLYQICIVRLGENGWQVCVLRLLGQSFLNTALIHWHHLKHDLPAKVAKDKKVDLPRIMRLRVDMVNSLFCKVPPLSTCHCSIAMKLDKLCLWIRPWCSCDEGLNTWRSDGLR